MVCIITGGAGNKLEIIPIWDTKDYSSFMTVRSTSVAKLRTRGVSNEMGSNHFSTANNEQLTPGDIIVMKEGSALGLGQVIGFTEKSVKVKSVKTGKISNRWAPSLAVVA